MIVYRLCKNAYKDDLVGKGAEIAGGRWNSRGKAVLYTSSSRALCVAEIAVHIPLGSVPDDYCMLILQLPAKTSLQEIEIKDLPPAWRSLPYINTVQGIGDRFLKERKYLVLKVPSAVIQGDYNFLINSMHPDFNKMEVASVEPFEFDERLFIK